MESPRIVSLLPSSTEIVATLGLTDRLVGRSHECDYPPEVQSLPALTTPRFETTEGAGNVHREVSQLVKQGLSVYSVDAELLAKLQPDYILTQTQCEVCAASEEDVRRAVQEQLSNQPEIISLAPEKLDHVWSDIENVGRALGQAEEAHRLAEEYRERSRRIADKARKLPKQPSVATIEWMEPLMAAGNWMPEMIDMAGGVNLFGKTGRHSPSLEWDVLQTADPDVILIMPCGYDIHQSLDQLNQLRRRSSFDQLTAVREGRAFVLDGNQYFNRPGPRLVESLEILAEILHPETFHFGHKDQGWMEIPQG
jgi:iron complex transport system substrate-binding protein